MNNLNKLIYVQLIDENFGEVNWYFDDGDSQELISEDDVEEYEMEPTGFEDAEDALYAAKIANMIAASSGIIGTATFQVWDKKKQAFREVKINKAGTASYK